MSETPQDKYDRLKRIPNWKQETLANAKVAVFGCGALGNEVLKNLALLGVGHIWAIDDLAMSANRNRCRAGF